MNVDISIIIVSFNTKDLLEKCLESIQLFSESVSTQIIVIDNASSDDTCTMISQKFPWVELLRNEINYGFARANNQGLTLSTGRYIFYLNPDTILFPETLQDLKNFMDKNNAGAVGPKTLLDPKCKLEVCSLKLLTPERARAVFTHLPHPNRHRILQEIWNIDFDLWMSQSPMPVEGIGGAAFFTRRDIMMKKKGMDEQFFMGYEDTDLAAYLHLSSLPIYYLPHSRIIHYFGQSKQHPDAPRKSVYSLHKAPSRFIKKYYGTLAASRFFLLKSVDRLIHSPTSVQTQVKNQSQTETLTLEWDHHDFSNFIFEISNDEPFFDKFGAWLDSPKIDIPASLLTRLAPGRYHHRVMGIRTNSQPIPITSGIIELSQ